MSPQHYQSMRTTIALILLACAYNDAVDLEKSQHQLARENVSYLSNNDQKITDIALKDKHLKNINGHHQQYHAINQQLTQENIALRRIKNNLDQTSIQQKTYQTKRWKLLLNRKK